MNANNTKSVDESVKESISTDRETILIVDDSEMNREILKAMLEDEYDIMEADNGQTAIDILTDYYVDIKLVLLDINMPVMDGKKVLRIMGNKLWMEHIPVVCISSDNTDETLQTAYDLGVVDYFTRPFDRESVLRRVHNMIHIYDKNSIDLRDAIGMLSAFFHRILKVNLSTGNYLPLKDSMEDISGKYENITDIYERLQSFAWKGFVHEEDRQEYLRFCNRDFIQEQFDAGKTELTFQYRRRVNEEYQWISMEFYRSAEYTDDNKVILLYVRDINDDYLKQLDALRRRNAGMFGIISVNITKNLCIACSVNKKELELLKGRELFDDYVKRISSYFVNKEEAEKNQALMNQKHLLECFEKGQAVIFNDVTSYDGEKREYVRARVTVEMIKDSNSGDIEGLLYYTNITNQYLAEQMTALLYQRNFDKVQVLNSVSRTVVTDLPEVFGSGQSKLIQKDYNDYVQNELLKDVSEKDHRTLKRKASIETIVDSLKVSNRYSFTIRKLENGEWRIKEYSYVNLSPKLHIYLGAVEDITDVIRKDSLTGGLNRHGFVVEVERMLEQSDFWGNYAIFFFDVHNFKGINELFGMQIGDLVLREVYRTMSESSLKPLAIARVESDHFACLIERKYVDEELLKAICQLSYMEKTRTIPIALRCGIYYPDKRESDVGLMLDLAEHAKDSIKDETGKPYQIFDDSMRANYVDKAMIVAEAETGVKNNEFKVYYQPIVDVQTEEIVSAEALVRWIHPEKGFISPGIFIPVLEENGHISEVDSYVSSRVRDFLVERKERGARDIPVSVNFSRMDFYDEKMMTWALRDLEKMKERGITCRIEITETSVAAIGKDQKDLLAEIKKRGATLLMDDFGSGYSSFNMLQDYDFDILKVDREFIRQIEVNEKSRGIVAAVIDMAHVLGMRVIAEGVETKEQVEFLRKCNCDYIQGFYFYRPLPEEEFKALLD